MQSEDDKHMHDARISVVSADRVELAWRMFEAGKNVYTADIKLVRKK